MEVVPLAFESFGVRGMATYVDAGVKVFIDPSAALGPLRYGLPPHRTELEALSKAKGRIHGMAEKSDILVITHYHFDHHDPGETFYKGKVVLAKDAGKKINQSQRERGTYFRERVGGICDLRYADDKSYRFDKTTVSFSPPFPHGPRGIPLGYVIMCRIKCKGEVVVHSSDVQGPVLKAAADWIIMSKPDILILDGPPTYFLGYRFSVKNMEKAKSNLLRIIRETGCEVILDHHLLRDEKYLERYAEVYATEKAKSAAEYVGMENVLLEMRRKELWGGG